MRLRVLLTVFVLVLPFASRAEAQFDTGHVAGFVRDASKAPIPGATVTVQNEGNRDRRSGVTDSSGYYAFPDLPVGSYRVTIELSGFKRFVKTAIKLSASAQLSVDAQLEVGSVAETVEVAIDWDRCSGIRRETGYRRDSVSYVVVERAARANECEHPLDFVVPQQLHE